MTDSFPPLTIRVVILLRVIVIRDSLVRCALSSTLTPPAPSLVYRDRTAIGLVSTTQTAVCSCSEERSSETFCVSFGYSD